MDADRTLDKRPSTPWLPRSILAGIVSACAGLAVAVWPYWSVRLTKPAWSVGSGIVDDLSTSGAGVSAGVEYWTVMIPVVVAFALFAGALSGLALGGGMKVALQGTARRTALGRLVAGASAGALVGCTIPAVLTVAGFGAIRAPYMGEARFLGAVLLACTLFVTLIAPVFDEEERRLRFVPRLGVAALASTLVAVFAGTMGWLAITGLGLVPDLQWIQRAAFHVGLLNLAMAAGVIVSIASGLYVGFTTWLTLLLSRTWSPAGQGLARG